MRSVPQLLVLGAPALAQTIIPQLHNQTGANFNSTPAFNETLLEVLNATEHATSCNDCYGILRILKSAAELGDAAFAELSVQFCIDAQEDDPDVCMGLETLEAPSVAYALRSMDIPSRTAQIFCESLYGLCNQPPVLNYSVPFPKPKPNTTRPKPSNRQPIEIVHLSDLHVDHNYTVGSSYNCSKSICCRPYNATFAAGSPLADAYPAEPYGEYYCDAPVSLEESQFHAVAELVPERAFTITTGDIVEGFTWGTSDQEVLYDVSDSYAQQSAVIGQVFPAVGNHDANPVNFFPPAGVNTSYGNQYDYDNLARDWEHWIDAAAAEQVRSNFASYSTTWSSGCGTLRIISINTIFWEGVNWWIYNTTMPRDPSGVLAFMVTELQKAEDNGERVWIIGHIPPGRPEALYDYSSYLDQVVQRYDATIAAMFWGHTHRDQFEISYSGYTNQKAENAGMVGYIAPSLTPTSGNPNFRVYSVDPETFAVLDYTVYYANLSAPTYHTAGPKFEYYYSAKSAYGSLLSPPVTGAHEELTPAFWHNVTALFETDDAVFQEYYDRKQRGWDYVPCNGTCKTDELCQLRSAQSQYACLESNAPMRKRDANGMPVLRAKAQEEECSGSRMVPILHAMAGDLQRVKKRAERA